MASKFKRALALIGPYPYNPYLIFLLFMAIIKKQANLEKKDVLVLLILALALTALVIFIPKILPELFSFTRAEQQYQSVLQSIFS